jgi:hypothetical protein
MGRTPVVAVINTNPDLVELLKGRIEAITKGICDLNLCALCLVP